MRTANRCFGTYFYELDGDRLSRAERCSPSGRLEFMPETADGGGNASRLVLFLGQDPHWEPVYVPEHD